MVVAARNDIARLLTDWPASELVHSEALIDRSQLHDWKIRPHKHVDLIQLFLLVEGHGNARLDSVPYALDAPCLLVVPQGCVHEFDWARSSDGLVVSIRSAFITAMTRQFGKLDTIFESPALIDLTEADPFVNQLIATIHHDATHDLPLNDLSIESMIRVLAIWLMRHSGPHYPSSTPHSRTERHYARFVKLVDQYHAAHWSVSRFASALGVTPSYLNAICQKIVGKSTLEIIHERLIFAARRELAYTERDIAGVAHHLGFADPSYFTRFFKREMGMTPGKYRRRSGTHNSIRPTPPVPD